MRTWVYAFALSTTLGACGGGEDTEVRPGLVEYAARIERSAAGRLSAEQEANLIAELERLVVEDGERFRVGDDFVYGRKSLEFYLEWHGSAEEPGTAFDVDDPEHPIHAIRSYARQCSEQGATLIVVPVPTPIEVLPSRFDGVELETRGGSTFTGTAPGTRALLVELAEEGIEVIDLLPALTAASFVDGQESAQRTYLYQDYHWTPRAASIAVEEICKRLEELPGYQPGSAKEGLQYSLVSRAVEHTLYGPHRPPPEPITINSVLGADGSSIDVRDKDSSILVLGDSYCGQYQGYDSDLFRQLYRRTAQTLDVISMPAGAATAWKALARRDHPLKGKKFVVWVFTVRAFGLQTFEDVDLSRD